MWIKIATIGFLITILSVIAIVVFGILFIIDKKKNMEKNRFSKSLLISLGFLIISIAIVVISILYDISGYSKKESSVSTNNDSQITNVKTKNYATISVSDLKKIKLGDSYKTVEKVLGNPKEINKDLFMWHYDGDDKLSKDSYAVISFDFENKVESIEQKGIISKDTTRVDADGIDNFDNPKKSTGMYKEDKNSNQLDTKEDDKDLVQYDTEDVINSFVDKNFKSGTELTKLELNENMGTKKKNDYIALVHMKMDRVYSAKSGFDWIDKYTNYLAAELADHDNNISELVIFWTMPQFADKNYNVAKYNLKRNGKDFYFEKKWKDNRFLDY